MKEIKEIRLFLSSPGDVEAERQKVPVVAAQINRMLGDCLNCHLEVIDWKTHVAPDMDRPQEVINRQIGDYDIIVGIMWKRFGTPTGMAESGTEEEFNKAYANWQLFRRPRILFYFSQAPYTLKNKNENEQLGRVIEFKTQLQQKGLIFEYQTPDEFADLLREHLARILQEWFPSEGKTQPITDFSCYLNYLKKDTMYIDIRGLVTGEGRAHQFGIDQLYIPLKTTGAGLLHEKGKTRQRPEETAPREVPLQEVLQEPKLIIKGDPGAGKTTFLKLITYTLCRKWLGEEPASGPAGIVWPESPPLPIFIRLGKLIAHIRAHINDKKEKGPAQFQGQEAGLAWLFHFLEAQSRECNWKITGEIFRREMEAGHALILLDGLDEAPDPKTREKVSALAEQLIKTFPGCRVVLTSRPAALIGLAAVPPGFSLAEIAPLDEQAMKAFLTKWSAALYFDASEKSSGHRQELWEALQARPEIRRMARTPVMLTALAVVHWNENRLPEQRAELYESIITWLLRAREQRPGRLNTDQCRKLLQLLALAMFTTPEGRLRQVGLRRAAEMLADEFIPAGKNIEKEEAGIKRQAIERAGRFLEDEMIDSGIIVKRGNELEFWHLSFQEYLAAYEIAGLLDNERLELLFEKERLYSSEWREPALLLGGVLYKQGKEKINHLIDAIIKRGPQEATHKNLPRLAREVGLLGGIMRDLTPFEFQPKNPRYQEVVKSVNGIFNKDVYRDIPAQVRVEAADALGQVGDPRLEGDPMISIPGSIFWMGAQKKKSKEKHYDRDAYDDESPVHQVELSPFSMSAYPITVGQYRRFIEDGGYEDKRLWGAGGFGQFKAPDKWEDQLEYPSRPVVYISWYEAAAYAHWADGRLPTEAEWERSGRGPSREYRKYRKYPWGNKKPDEETANFDDSKLGHITPVGIFSEDCSPEGVIEMAGNVWEWCSDWFSEKYYQMCAGQGVVTNPPGPVEGNARVVRGGAFDYDPDILRCAFRYRDVPDGRFDNLGFRMVRGAQS